MDLISVSNRAWCGVAQSLLNLLWGVPRHRSRSLGLLSLMHDGPRTEMPPALAKTEHDRSSNGFCAYPIFRRRPPSLSPFKSIMQHQSNHPGTQQEKTIPT